MLTPRQQSREGKQVKILLDIAKAKAANKGLLVREGVDALTKKHGVSR
jgi:hypothetical protein